LNAPFVQLVADEAQKRRFDIELLEQWRSAGSRCGDEVDDGECHIGIDEVPAGLGDDL
jgi:hypothetical protein